jgi:hypothetical protein
MAQRFNCKVYNFSAGQEIICFCRNQKYVTVSQKDPNLSQLNLVHTFIPSSFPPILRNSPIYTWVPKAIPTLGIFW